MAKSKLVLIMDWVFDQFIYPLFERQVNERVNKAVAKLRYP